MPSETWQTIALAGVKPLRKPVCRVHCQNPEQLEKRSPAALRGFGEEQDGKTDRECFPSAALSVSTLDNVSARLRNIYAWG